MPAQKTMGSRNKPARIIGMSINRIAIKAGIVSSLRLAADNDTDVTTKGRLNNTPPKKQPLLYHSGKTNTMPKIITMKRTSFLSI